MSVRTAWAIQQDYILTIKTEVKDYIAIDFVPDLLLQDLYYHYRIYYGDNFGIFT